jgi:hypothetical protein
MEDASIIGKGQKLTVYLCEMPGIAGLEMGFWSFLL